MICQRVSERQRLSWCRRAGAHRSQPTSQRNQAELSAWRGGPSLGRRLRARTGAKGVAVGYVCARERTHLDARVGLGVDFEQVAERRGQARGQPTSGQDADFLRHFELLGGGRCGGGWREVRGLRSKRHGVCGSQQRDHAIELIFENTPHQKPGLYGCTCHDVYTTMEMLFMRALLF